MNMNINMNIKYSYVGKILLLIIGVYIFYPFVDKYLNSLLGINKEGFVWSMDTIKKFNLYQNTVNVNTNQYNMSVVQEQSTEEEAKELLKTGYWPWSEDTKNNISSPCGKILLLNFNPRLL
jgi:hypothetical protein